LLESVSLERSVAHLLASTGFEGSFRLLPLPGGANNKVYRVEAPRERTFFLKVYFRHQEDLRDRLKQEYGFIEYAWKMGVRSVPEPVICDPEKGLGLYAYVEGQGFRPEDVTQEAVIQALRFYQTLNGDRESAESAGLPLASEACLTLNHYFEYVEERLTRLQKEIPESSQVDRSARLFVREQLVPTWALLRTQAGEQAAQMGWVPEDPLPKEDRCLSPSDFGFHNAIRRTDGSICFVDFEYAGWDDPMKMASDFFVQPQFPVPHDYYEVFLSGVAETLPISSWHRSRAEVIFPLCIVKWCCILLNDFLQIGQERRAFAANGGDALTRKSEQLAKASRLLRKLKARTGSSGGAH